MNDPLDRFHRALAVMHRRPAAKLLAPGAHKFLRRAAARRGFMSGPVNVPLFFGGRMTVSLPEVISETLYTYGFFDETVTWMALNSVRPGDTVLDIGAHFGYFSLLFAHLAGDGGRVLSFEPTPSTFGMLSANVRGSRNIEAINCAAADTPGETLITDFGLKYSAWNTLAAQSRMDVGAAGRQLPVQAVRPDAVCGERGLAPAFIKIDAENFEDRVVAGLSEVIARHRPRVLMETGSGPSLAATKALVASGYTLKVSDGPGSLYGWSGTAEEANSRFKDVLFEPHASR